MRRWQRLGLGDANHVTYWNQVRLRALELGADGCSGVADIYVEACLEHDIHYRTHKTIYGTSLTRAQADQIFRERIQQFSALDGFSPMAWWRWAGVRLFGGKAWDGA